MVWCSSAFSILPKTLKSLRNSSNLSLKSMTKEHFEAPPPALLLTLPHTYSPYRTDAFHIKARYSIMPQPYLASRWPEHPAQTIKPLEKKKDDPPIRVAFIPTQCQFKKSRNDPNSSVKIYPENEGELEKLKNNWIGQTSWISINLHNKQKSFSAKYTSRSYINSKS